MIISDLNYLEVVSQANSIEGGNFLFSLEGEVASANATALSYGDNAVALTSTYTKTIDDKFAGSNSQSYSSVGGAP